jgi:xanthosine utilization system XapX-like protein
MDFYTLMFWAGFAVLIVSHVLLFKSMPQHSTIALVATILMFVGSKIGRKFLGLE